MTGTSAVRGMVYMLYKEKQQRTTSIGASAPNGVEVHRR